MMTRQILNRWTGAVLWSGPAETVKDAIHAAIAARADLTGANLTDADLTGADLTGADLTGAYLTDAYLTGANLTDANLTDADLTDAYLTGAYLTGADLTDANLTDAYLTGANLTGAYLTGADLTGANLTSIRDDLWAVLSGAPAEVPALLTAITAGRIDGSTYAGECACLVGTIANARGCGYRQLGATLQPNSDRPAEIWFLGIRPGDTPSTNVRSAFASEWITDWLDQMRATFGAGVS
ncbi:MAG TPA: pentapeptide repeat-containing protein [Gemmatimonadaceae bacterium]|nr:pentapeptide repeat-containing protein [Gemmatimonadaceae bacterium]